MTFRLGEGGAIGFAVLAIFALAVSFCGGPLKMEWALLVVPLCAVVPLLLDELSLFESNHMPKWLCWRTLPLSRGGQLV